MCEDWFLIPSLVPQSKQARTINCIWKISTSPTVLGQIRKLNLIYKSPFPQPPEHGHLSRLTFPVLPFFHSLAPVFDLSTLVFAISWQILWVFVERISSLWNIQMSTFTPPPPAYMLCGWSMLYGWHQQPSRVVPFKMLGTKGQKNFFTRTGHWGNRRLVSSSSIP